VDDGLFDEVAEALKSLVPAELGVPRTRARRYGIKVWFGPVEPPREHYEAQVVGAEHVAGTAILGLEIGFHAENRDPDQNAKAIASLRTKESRWRRRVGAEAEIAGFLGRPDEWWRISEVWPDPDLGDDDLGFEIATRLTDYVVALEPFRR
jgi:hypothetical protein